MKVLLVLMLCFVSFAYYTNDKGLNERLACQIAQLDRDVSWDVSHSAEDISLVQSLCVAPFYFLGKGKQCEAYVSQNNEYVLKIITQRRFYLKPFVKSLPDFYPFSFFKKYRAEERFTRKQALFTSFLLSYTKIRDETAMVFLHLKPSQGLFGTVFIINEQGEQVAVDLDASQFVIQKRAALLKPSIAKYMGRNEMTRAKQCVNEAFRLLFDCAKKGVYDVDTGLVRNNNIGLLKGRAIYIDTGKLRYFADKKAKEYFIQDLKRLKPLHKWLSLYYPELAKYYEEQEFNWIAAY